MLLLYCYEEMAQPTGGVATVATEIGLFSKLCELLLSSMEGEKNKQRLRRKRRVVEQ
jgi:hypothetical protein